MTFYIPVLVSILTAAAAAWATIRNTRVTTRTQREMANLADQTAREFKEKDYKNDFYKKIIDKRFTAWEHAERFIELISVSKNIVSRNGYIYAYFINKEEFVKVQDALISLNARSFWMDSKYRVALENFSLKLGNITRETAKVSTHDEHTGLMLVEIDNDKLYQAGLKYHIEMTHLVRQMMMSQSAILTTLHDIDAFLAENKQAIHPD